MKPAANLSLLWPELPFLDRFDAASAAGFDAVEVLFPYDIAAGEIQRALLMNGQQLILINAPPPNYTGGARGFAALPGGEDRFRHDMKRVFRYADVLGVRFVHVMTGIAEGTSARDTLLRNLDWAAKAAPEGLTLTLEPLNSVAMPGYFLNDYALARDILEALGADNVGLQYDSYHAQMIHGDAVAVFQEYQSLIVHAQIGDAPDRGPPGRGTVDFKGLFAAMRGAAYTGWISAEYHPKEATEKTLDWMQLL